MTSTSIISDPNARSDRVQLVVTGPGVRTRRRLRPMLQKSVPGAQVHRTGFPSVFVLEAAGDPLEIAKTVTQMCGENIGHVTAVFAEVDSRFEPIRDAVARIGADQIAESEKFCFRLHKRGSHWLEKDSCSLEREIGGALWEAVKEKRGTTPIVDLEHPDITVIAEVLGPKTAIGISRRAWAIENTEETTPTAQEGPSIV